MLNYDKTCVVLTGCIKPESNVFKLALKDEEARLQQYLESINYFICETKVKKIVFCDNSNYAKNESIMEKARKYGKEFEWLSFQGDTAKTLTQGKGYGEGEIIDYVLDYSQIIKDCDSFIKVTGRLKVKNIRMFFALLSHKYSYFVVSEDYVDTRCYMANISIFKDVLREAYKNVNDPAGYYLEHAYYDVIAGKSDKFKSLPFYANIEGMSGSSGKIYYEAKFKYILRTFKRFVVATKENITKN